MAAISAGPRSVATPSYIPADLPPARMSHADECSSHSSIPLVWVNRAAFVRDKTARAATVRA